MKTTKKVKSKILVFVFFVVFVLFLVYNIQDYYEERAFLRAMVGEIVFIQRDDAGILNIYKISANGQNKQMLYHNDDPVNSNSMGPLWSEDGSKIYFSAMKNGEWIPFSMNSEGNNITIISEDEATSFYNSWRLNICPICIESKNNNLDIRDGSLYYMDPLGKEIKIYSIINYNAKFNIGVNNPSWSPDKNFIVFESCEFFTGCNIYIADREGGRITKLTKGMEPNWKS